MKNNGLWFIVIQAGHIWLTILKEEKIDIKYSYYLTQIAFLKQKIVMT